ncbi:MAG: GDP-mannose 4,6-dehydratase [Aggregatilineales bacterium]
MNALITGAGGFVGRHLLTYLCQHMSHLTLHGTLFSSSERRTDLEALGCQLWTLDLRDAEAVRDLLAQVRPERIYHLAGQAFVPRSFAAPWETLEVNIRGTLNLLEAARTLGLAARILVVSSADIYGAAPPDALPLTESAPFIPSSPYSVSKIAQDMLAWQFARAHSMYIVRARPFNHIGTGQNIDFAVPNWASQIAAIELGQREPVVSVGNLDAARDFTDVRDVVRAYALALERGTAGAVYNVCSGTPQTMQHILETLISLSQTPIAVRVDPERVRPIEIPTLYGSYARLKADTDWQPQISLAQSLRDVLNEWRIRLRSA